jgi:hypothetical protein
MELTINNLIKIIIGILVFVAVILGVSLFFKDNIFSFFKNLGNFTREFLYLLK